MGDEIKEEKPLTLEEWEKFFSRTSDITRHADEIATALEKGHRCSFVGFDTDGAVKYSYWDGCHCHGQNEYGTFAASLLFNEQAIENIKANHAKEAAAKEEKRFKELEAGKAKKEADERKEFERLSQKFGTSQ